MSRLQARNEIVINAASTRIWEIITDIDQLHKINPGVVKASGQMNREGATRSCEINNKGKSGRMTERLIELVPEKKTIWTLEDDTMGMSRMLRNTRFCFYLEKIDDTTTKLVNESYYTPASLMAKVMNMLVLKKMFSKTQQQILSNIKGVAENRK